MDNELGDLSVELRRLNILFGVFSELVTGSRDQFKIRAISSSEFGIFLAALPEVAAAIANALQQVVTLYGSILGIIVIHRQLGDHKLSQGTRDMVKKEIDEKVSAGIQQIAATIERQHFANIDETRKPELRKSLTDVLLGIARRLDEGYGFECAASPQKNRRSRRATQTGTWRPAHRSSHGKEKSTLLSPRPGKPLGCSRPKASLSFA